MADYMRHERERWGYMDHRQLLQRLSKITTLAKLECFVSQAEAVARRRSPTNVVVQPAQATELLAQAMYRARDLGFTSLEGTARNLLEGIQDSLTPRLNPASGLSQDLVARQRAITLSQQLPALTRSGFEALFRNRNDFSQEELTILIDFFEQVLTHQFDGTYAITKGDAANLCRRVYDFAYRKYWGPIANRADEVSRYVARVQPQPRPTHRVVRIRKKEK